jgi:Phytanoyl-CoA dioxygenase (PhyH)
MLKENLLQQQLEDKGFVKFPFLNQFEVERLKQLFTRYDDSHPANGRLHHSTFHIGNRIISEQVDKEIKIIIGPAIEKHFCDYELFVANFMIKEPGDKSEVVPHQDWNYVNEPTYMSLNLWIPLQDVDENNGCLTFLPRSHALFNTMRTTPSYPALFEKVMPLAKKNMVHVDMKAGEGILFYHATLHGSPDNKSQIRRLNVVQGIYPKGAQLQHYFFDAVKNEVEQYDISLNDFYRLTESKIPEDLQPSRKFKFDFPQISETQFFKLYPGSTGIINRLKAMLHG